jgi:3-oxoacyl-[acyl-carrier protein] reductase
MTLTSGTQSWESIFGEDSYQKDLFAKALDRFPFGAAPSAHDVSEAVVFLASARAAHVTGQTLSVNGGLSFGGW